MPKLNHFDPDTIKNVFQDNKALKSDGTEPGDAAVGLAMGRVNQTAIIDEADAMYVTEEWDRTSPVNGMSARDVVSHRSDIPPPPGKVYIIKRADTGRVIMFQPFKPGVGGRQSMTDKAEFDSICENARSQMCNDKATSEIKRAFLLELDKE